MIMITIIENGVSHMKKLNVIVGKKQIVLASLVVILGVAVYLNWQFAKNDGQFDITTGMTSSDKNYGDATLVNQSDSYFTQARLDKEKSRDASVETLAQQAKEDSLSASELKQVKEAAEALNKQIKAEETIETMVKAKGFEDCLAYLDDGKARLIVKTEGLNKEEVAQIKDIILQSVEVLNENISIVEKK